MEYLPSKVRHEAMNARLTHHLQSIVHSLVKLLGISR